MIASVLRVSVVVSGCVAAAFLVREVSRSALMIWQAGHHLRSYESQLTMPDFDERPFLDAVRRLEPRMPTSRVALIITSASTECNTSGGALATWTLFARRTGLAIMNVDVATDTQRGPEEKDRVSPKDLFAVSTGVWVTPTGVVINDAGRVSCIVRGAPTAVDLQRCEMSMRGIGLFMRDVGHWNSIL